MPNGNVVGIANYLCFFVKVHVDVIHIVEEQQQAEDRPLWHPTPSFSFFLVDIVKTYFNFSIFEEVQNPD